MMPTPWNIPCEVDYKRAQTKHAFLDRGILNTAAGDRVDTWLRGSDEEIITLKFPGHLVMAKELAEDMIVGYSPVHLVDRLEPLQWLDEETRSAIKEAVHAAYLEKTEITALAGEFAGELKTFTSSFKEFLDRWQTLERRSENRAEMEQAWLVLQEAAKKLHVVTEKIPQGVVLP